MTHSPSLSRRSVLVSAAAAAGLAAAPAFAQSTPATVVEGFYAALLDIMKAGKDAGFQGRFAKLKPAFEKAFDVTFMSRFVAGPAWDGMTEDQRKKLVAAFTDFSVAFYARNFRAFDGESFVVEGAREIPQGTMVTSRIVPKADKPVPMNYLLRKGDAGFKIIDVFLDGTISQLATRRTDFAATLRDQGAAGLIQVLEAKTREQAQAG